MSPMFGDGWQANVQGRSDLLAALSPQQAHEDFPFASGEGFQEVFDALTFQTLFDALAFLRRVSAEFLEAW